VQGALEGHPGGQRLDLVQRDLVVVTHAALVRAEHVVVLHAVTLEQPVSPLSSRTGKFTISSFLGWERISLIDDCRPQKLAAFSNCCWATA
jgi:hypothetical protein